MRLFVDPEQALAWITRLVAIGVLLDTLELVYCRKQFDDEQLFAWRWLRRSRFFSARRLFPHVVDLLLDRPLLIPLILVRGVSAVLLIVLPQATSSSTVALALVFAISSLLNLRAAPYGVDTPSRFTIVIVGALLLRGGAPGSPILAQVCLWFIALQACISYATAGMVKLFNEGWRSGVGLFNVANASTLGMPLRLATLLARHEVIGRGLTWFTIAMECAFPLVLLLPTPFSFFFIAWGLLFHLTIASLLGLNRFFWAWIATYPAILYVTQR